MITDLKILNEAAHLLENGTRLALCTVIEKRGSGPRDVGAKMIVGEDEKTYGTIGGGALERALVNECMKALEEGKSRRVTFNMTREKKEGMVETGLICGGELTVFVDVLEPDLRLIIVGSGHVALPLARLAEIVGFKTLIVDDDIDLANKERFPMAERIITGDFAKILNELDVGSNDSVVIAHGEPEHDYKALEKMIEKKPAYIGLLGSRTKVAILVQRLRKQGISEAQLKILHAPLGLDIGAQTPEEIGISVLAEIIQSKRKRT
ncbi:MAG: XdhC family protein [Candidatus Freyarchaeum deiterrae]